MKKYLIPVLMLTYLLVISACEHNTRYSLQSPDGSLKVIFSLTETGEVRYAVSRNQVTVLNNSKLGIVLDDRDLSEKLELLSATKPTLVHSEYELRQGKRRHNTYTAMEQVFHLQNLVGQKLDIAFRVSNDGVAFQYHLPGESVDIKTVRAETTSFAFTDRARAWLQPVAVAQTGWMNTNPSYEEHYIMDVPVTEVNVSEAGWVFPSLFKTDGGWALITEAGMDGRYHASRLQGESRAGEFRIGYPMDAERYTDGALMGQSQLPFKSPWRIIAIGELATIAESSLGTDLAAPAIAPMDWVKPGTASWSWALLKDESVNYDTQLQFIDYAAAMGWRYVLVDVNWDQNIGYEKMAELAGYAAEKNVGLLLWYNSSGPWNKTEYTPKSQLLTREQRRTEFARLQQMGIAGIKVDFFAGDGVSMVDYYRQILTDAAEFELLVNFHGATLPRGLHRTFPNFMTAEAVHGFEMITFMQNSADRAAAHMAMLPFTRNAFDPMDFTPTVFSEIPNIERRTSNGFELALPVLFLSGIQHVAETDTGMMEVAPFVREYLRDIPAVWEESRLLDGFPGKFAVIARRSGASWYVSGINAQTEEKTVQLDLSFMGPRLGSLITDGDDTRTLVRRDIESGIEVNLGIKGNGGFTMVFPADPLAKN
ncbi:glycoside hydrolase family 97 catalytic domain-containing protein [Microbulbifer bruguierae]|uniref:Glycoside hydrolase family 97 catalytic domain-containing protein n=1 Tax=Microbulbifer bruguierae TaxID=3029061 RepID=A0ABY8NC97_9GAMM|nr:glycoside hydrolase family 97 protein [Microbulbifer bruguierae]WGL16070.1 glycoside hydrolase family 97 catalytic domain-containing protein [Microbulbifer bruguierae]